MSFKFVFRSLTWLPILPALLSPNKENLFQTIIEIKRKTMKFQRKLVLNVLEARVLCSIEIQLIDNLKSVSN